MCTMSVREPSAVMVTAAINRPVDEAANDYSSVWRAMIDKVLAP